MRISVYDEGFSAWGTRVFLDDVEQRGVTAANEELGQVVVHQRDAQGNLILNAERTEIETLTLHGRMRIELPATNA